jgi:signal transduction histidine kinase
MGLQNLESRVKSLDGEFQIESGPGRGTSIYVEFDRKRLGGE